jgi:hypothetical protein
MQGYGYNFVVVDTSLLDECTLGIGNKVIHEGDKPDDKNLSDDLCNGMNRLIGLYSMISMLAEFNH